VAEEIPTYSVRTPGALGSLNSSKGKYRRHGLAMLRSQDRFEKQIDRVASLTADIVASAKVALRPLKVDAGGSKVAGHVISIRMP
jgi:hypothetical protein